VWVIALNDWSASETVSFFVVMVVMLVVLRFNRPVARLFLNFTSLAWPPTRLPREDRPEKLRELREAHAAEIPVWRFSVVAFALGVFVASVVVLIHGPN
jgi:hypothetical protein